MGIFRTKNTPRIRDYVELFVKVENVIKSLDNFNQLGAAYRYIGLFDKFLEDSLFQGRTVFKKGTVEHILYYKRESVRFIFKVREDLLIEDRIRTKREKL